MTKDVRFVMKDGQHLQGRLSRARARRTASDRRGAHHARERPARCGPGHAPRHAGRRLRRRPVRRSESGHGRVLRLRHVHGLGRVGPRRRAQLAGPQPARAGHDRGVGPHGGVPPPRVGQGPHRGHRRRAGRAPLPDRGLLRSARRATRPSARSWPCGPSRRGADDGRRRRRGPGQHGQRRSPPTWWPRATRS